jgi:hypothetical protein
VLTVADMVMPTVLVLTVAVHQSLANVHGIDCPCWLIRTLRVRGFLAVSQAPRPVRLRSP